MHYGDMTDATNLIRMIQETQPDEIYNLAAQSHVQVSSRRRSTPPTPMVLAPCGCSKPFEFSGWKSACGSIKPRHRSFTESAQEIPQRETTPFYPRSPYAAAKLYAYWITVNYREAYGIHASNGILFNHEGPTRGETFVTRKITRAVAAINTDARTKSFSAISMPNATGVMPAITSRACGSFCSSPNLMIMCWRPEKPTRARIS